MDGSSFTQEYLKIDGFSNAVDNLEKSCYFMAQSDDPYRWKWIAICLTDALYGFMICALEGSNFERVVDMERMKLKDKKRLEELRDLDGEAYFEYRRIIEDYIHSQNAHLISFNEALDRVQIPRYMELDCFSKPIKCDPDEVAHIKQLRRAFRNQFIHFMPKSWWIEQRYFLPLVKDTLAVTERLFSSCNLSIHERERLDKAKDSLAQMTELLKINKGSLETPTASN